MRAALRPCLLIAVIAVALGAGCSNQSPRVLGAQVTRPTRASVSGIVHDSAGHPKAGAQVTIDGSGVHRETTTDSQGTYAFADLAPGPYDLVAKVEEAAPVGSAGVQLGAAARSTKKSVILQVGPNIIDISTGG